MKTCIYELSVAPICPHMAYFCCLVPSGLSILISYYRHFIFHPSGCICAFLAQTINSSNTCKVHYLNGTHEANFPNTSSGKVICIKPQSFSFPAQLNSAYYIELPPCNCLRSASGSQLVFKTY